jgi:3-hydroxyisobutyrate dehydrogenase-like beta-hydroxyacid dehydrogenase
MRLSARLGEAQHVRPAEYAPIVTTIGIVSPGAMGSEIGRVLVAGGARVVTTVEGRSSRTARLAAGLELLPSLEDVLAASDVVLSVVPPALVREVAAAIARAASVTGASPLVADLNATAPSTMREVAGLLADGGLRAVDGSISGPPPRAAGTTVVYLSGPEAARVASLAAPGLELRYVGETIGRASAVKMSTASFYKGQAAVFAQALRAAHANGVLELVLDDLGSAHSRLVAGAPRLLQSIAAKSGRYVGEMAEISLAQRDAGLAPELFAAFALVYEQLSRTGAATRPPEEIDEQARLEDVLGSLERPG